MIDNPGFALIGIIAYAFTAMCLIPIALLNLHNACLLKTTKELESYNVFKDLSDIKNMTFS